MSTGTKFHTGSLEPLTKWLSYTSTSFRTEGTPHPQNWRGRAMPESLSFVAKKDHHCVTLPQCARSALTPHNMKRIRIAWQSKRRLSSVQKFTNYVQHRHRLAKRSEVRSHHFKKISLPGDPQQEMQSKRVLLAPAYRKITHLVYVHVTKVNSFPPEETDNTERRNGMEKRQGKVRIVLNMH
jgi:hypothetical protein